MNDHILERAANVPATGPLAEALRTRSRLMELTQASHDAALRPATPGSISFTERAALAARMVQICKDSALADHYIGLAGATVPAWATPDTRADDARLDALIAYADKITLSPRDATPEDIDALRAAGIDEGDIVRLAGLVAFVNYQLRVAKVLRAMGGTR
ncbi:CMD domain-containing protein [Roseinatronobacter alkalisoli]|uniref:CMD domain protein n=1 Tax=Roseinatronobacter alkalisoli TaxID=3028235 RepID=A0ABT5TB56_9RHOB|nr:hypothetical protein [Roseinatronobacter sp. HJB301]MDD7972355.1 hypothetical protein [Roseinatronobacter sp. HJB301]